MNYFQLLILLTITMILSSCGEGELFGPKAPPLPGTRLNVLHYDLLKEKTLTKEEVTIPSQTELMSWNTSDIGQFTGIPSNIKLNHELIFLKNIDIKSNYEDTCSNVSGMPVAIANDVIYSYCDGVLSAYKISFNKVIWSAKAIKGKAREDIIGGAIAHTDDVVYLSSGERDFIAFNAHNGKELWRYTAPNVVRYIPTISNGFIYLSSTDNTLLCLDLDGNLIWRYDAPIYSLITSRIYNPNIIYQDKIINITTAGDMIVLNRHDGTELFQVNLAITSVIGDGSLAKGPIASPVLVGDHLYILTGESDLIKIDLANPQILWRQNFTNAISMWIADNVTYLITDSNQLMTADNKNGQLIWVIDLNTALHKKDNTLFYGPVLAGDQLIVTAFEGDIFFLSSKDGKELSHFKNKNYTKQIPIIADEKAYFIGQNGIISVWK